MIPYHRTCHNVTSWASRVFQEVWSSILSSALSFQHLTFHMCMNHCQEGYRITKNRVGCPLKHFCYPFIAMPSVDVHKLVKGY